MKAGAYTAKFSVPFGVLGVRTTADALIGIDFLPRTAALLSPQDGLAREVGKQLAAYFHDPDFKFDLPLELAGTTHQSQVWKLMTGIPSGRTMTYGELATRLGSSPRAVGRACGDNPVPIVIPCHRVVSKTGVGGFMHRSDSEALDIKHWLLWHERPAT
jgi:methylated-DNA-[protein]-cysteine S-methyltransferase